jgi:hypothetical protein
MKPITDHLCDLLHARSAQGIQHYGQPIDDCGYSASRAMQEAIDEQADKLQYMELTRRDLLTLEAEVASLRIALSMHTIDSAYTHRLAIMLECALLDRRGAWDEGHALLDEYRAACDAVAPPPRLVMGDLP